jgi:predicted lipid-binding transport protein (Tim44 family)
VFTKKIVTWENFAYDGESLRGLLGVLAFLDIFIFMLISVFLGIRLWNVLGKGSKGSSTSKVVRLNRKDVKVEKKSPARAVFYEGFDEADFLSGAQKAFLAALTAYFQGDHEKLAKYVSPELLKKLAAQPFSRPPPTLTVLSLHVQHQELRGKLARVTVHFLSKQTSKAKKEEIEDEWVFERHLSAINPNWVIAEMRN